jgi:hypothetical protein
MAETTIKAPLSSIRVFKERKMHLHRAETPKFVEISQYCVFFLLTAVFRWVRPRPRGQTFGGDPCPSTGDTREALLARAQAHQLGRMPKSGTRLRMIV